MFFYCSKNVFILWWMDGKRFEKKHFSDPWSYRSLIRIMNGLHWWICKWGVVRRLGQFNNVGVEIRILGGREEGALNENKTTKYKLMKINYVLTTLFSLFLCLPGINWFNPHRYIFILYFYQNIIFCVILKKYTCMPINYCHDIIIILKY